MTTCYLLMLISLPPSFEMFLRAMTTRDDLPKIDILKIKIIEDYDSRLINSVGFEAGDAFYARGVKNFSRYQQPTRVQCFVIQLDINNKDLFSEIQDLLIHHVRQEDPDRTSHVIGATKVDRSLVTVGHQLPNHNPIDQLI